MPGPTFSNRPSLPTRVVREWPTPDGVHPLDWVEMSADERADWLVEYAYEEVGGGWVLRNDRWRTPTARLVERAVTTRPVLDMVSGPGTVDVYPLPRRARAAVLLTTQNVIKLSVLIVLITLCFVVIGALVASLFDDGAGDPDGTTGNSVCPVAVTLPMCAGSCAWPV